MKKAILLLASAALFLTGCNKDQVLGQASADDTAKVSVTTVLQSMDLQRRATIDADGAGANVDHWVVEVRDSLTTDKVYYHGEKDGTKGVLKQTFDLYLVKGHTYYIAFWADTKGCYTTADLTAVKCTDITKIGNCDDYDGFFKCIKYEVAGDATVTAQLYRPFAQVNIITTDLQKLKSTTTAEAYARYEPVDYSFKLTAPTVFSAFTGEASAEQEVTIVPTEANNHCYGPYADPAERTTIHMVYVLAGKNTMTTDAKDVRNIDFAFNTGNVKLEYDLQSIPLKRNYRTNIIGSFMTNTLKWNVEVLPDWRGELDETYTEEPK